MRIKRLTSTSCDSHKRRTSRLRPSVRVTSNHWLIPVPPTALICLKFAGPSSNCTPLRKRCNIASSTLPNTRTEYSRSTSRLGCIKRLASSPSVVKSNKPEVLISKRPTAIQREPVKRGKRSKTVARPSGSERVQSSPSGL